MAILLVEQYLDFCREIADHVHVMDRGDIGLDSTRKDQLQRRSVMWIVLSFTACLVSSPAQCETRELAFSADSVTFTQCQSQGVIMLAQWAEKHPKWQISGSYKCSTTRGREVEA